MDPRPDLVTRNGKRRRNFYLPEELMDRVQQVANRRGMTMTALLERSLTAYLRALEAKEGRSDA